jgi:hypothetical protein
MEIAPTSSKPGLKISIWSAFGGMLVMFLIGIYVGIHPNWIPIRSSPFEDFTTPAKIAFPPPATEPGEMPRAAQTQPEASTH